MNLIQDPWIPIARKGGGPEKIRPAQLAENYQKNPVLALDCPRPDFNGALLQFLIGLLQTVLVPEDEEWHDLYQSPPSVQELDELFSELTPAFNLDGKSPRFLQDFDLSEGVSNGIEGLFIEMPGENTVKNNTDHFVKRGQISRTCPACTATALFTLQTNAPSGGQGHRTSIRGGGPLTTALVPADPADATLWRKIWLNVLGTTFLKRTNCKSRKKADRFPWIAPTKTSESEDGVVSAVDMHPVQTFWAMPRRIVLDPPDNEPAICDVCGEEGSKFYSGYITKNYGVKYGGNIRHPLTPYYVSKAELLPYHPQPGGFTYRYWPNFAAGEQQDQSECALVLRQAHQLLSDFQDAAFHVLAFGYDMDNMKARCWYEGEMPYITSASANFPDYAQRLADAARMTALNTRKAIKDAWIDPKYKISGEIPFIEQEFWSITEASYYSLMRELASRDLVDETHFRDERRQWLNYLATTSLALFDKYVGNAALATGNPQHIVMARKNLLLSNYSKRAKKTLNLPEERMNAKVGA